MLRSIYWIRNFFVAFSGWQGNGAEVALPLLDISFCQPQVNACFNDEKAAAHLSRLSAIWP